MHSDLQYNQMGYADHIKNPVSNPGLYKIQKSVNYPVKKMGLFVNPLSLETIIF